MTLEQVIAHLYENPRKLFLIDGIGAVLSTFLLGVVLVRFEVFFGIPRSTLYTLATFPIILAVYDVYCYQKDTQKLSRLLKGIAMMNLLYCLISIGFALIHHQTISYWGCTYIIVEISILIFLAILELKVANRLLLK
jgi:hypothetical protein